MVLYPTNLREFLNIVGNLKSKKSKGTDGLNTIFVKDIIASIADILVIVFNKSFAEGVFPSAMKTAKIVPIYKAKEHNAIVNWRPISVLVSLSKIIESLTHVRITDFLNKFKILSPSQYGFCKRHSTVNAMSEVIGTVLKDLDKNKFSIVTFLDLSKAFDTVSHEILLEKLRHYGLRGKIYDWIKSYLENRKSVTRWQGSDSECIDNNCYGVPQGSILGPLLYINDMKNCLELSSSVN